MSSELLFDYLGPNHTSHGPGSSKFDGLVKSVATAATRVGAAANDDVFMFEDISRDMIRAQEKLIQAQKLLLGAHALLADIHKNAPVTKKQLSFQEECVLRKRPIKNMRVMHNQYEWGTVLDEQFQDGDMNGAWFVSVQFDSGLAYAIRPERLFFEHSH